MTTATLLRETYGPRRRLVCAIDGYQPLIWQDDGTGVAPTRPARSSPDVTDIVALEAPQDELSWGIDIGEMTVKPSAMTISFRDVDDPGDATVKTFGRLFAPGRHAASTSKSIPLKRNAADNPYIYATDTTLNVNGDNSGWSAPGYGYTSRETFYYTTAGGSSFSGCTRGLFSCTSLAEAFWAPTYKLPDYDNTIVSDMGVHVSTVPYSWLGRRISLWVVAYDDDLGAWRTNVSGAIDGSLLWIGRIQSIRFNGQRGTWDLGCEHIIADLEEKICNGMPQNAKLYGLNMHGPQGLAFQVWLDTGATTVTADAGVYFDHQHLAKNIVSKIANLSTEFPFFLSFDGERWQFGCYNDTGATVTARITRPQNSDYGCHPLNALGFKTGGAFVIVDFGEVSDGSAAWIAASDPPAVAYHPISRSVNGSKVHVTSLDPNDKHMLYDGTQNDAGFAASATVEIQGAEMIGPERVSGTYHVRYSGITKTTFANSLGTAGTLTMLPDQVLDLPYSNWAYHAYIAQRLGEEPKSVVNVYCPHYYDSTKRARGPFELLLHSLTSTGTSAYNDTYDTLPFECSAGMEASLVDVTSFLNADAAVMQNPLAQRRAYVIPSGISWLDLLQRECQLFGYVLAWESTSSSLSLRSAYMHDVDTWVETLSDGNGTDPTEFPDADMSDATVINRWEMSVQYDRVAGKYKAPIVVEDEDSIQQLRTAKTVKVQHPGVFIAEDVIGTVEDIVARTYKENRYCWRYPWQVVTKTLAPYLANRISIGDVVRFTSSRFPDPYGSGTRTTSCLALVLNVSWDLSTWTGKATLLLYSGYDATQVTPWAWSALTSSWDSVNLRLTVVAKTWGATADSDDAAEAEDGDIVDIVERAPADPSDPQKWTGLELASNYETDGANILTFVAGTTLTGWSTAKQYIVQPSLYGSVVTEQKSENAYQADSAGLLGSDPPHRYG